MNIEKDLTNQVFGCQLLDADSEKILDQAQIRLFQKWLRSKSLSVYYLGQEFVVHPKVFPPRPDSLVLAQSIDVGYGADVLDVGTGSGVLSVVAGIHLGWDKGQGAGSVVATDVSPQAVANATMNMNKKFKQVAKKRFVAYETNEVLPKQNQKFDVVMANLPLRHKPIDKFFSDKDKAMAMVRRTMWDQEFNAHQVLLTKGKEYLKADGYMLLTIANYSDALRALELICRNGWRFTVTNRREFYPCDDKHHYPIPLVVACLRLDPASI